MRDGAELLTRLAEKLKEPFEQAYHKLPDDDQITRCPDIEYTNRNGDKLTMDVYYRNDLADKTKPVIIFIHGGGLFAGDPRMSVGISRLFAHRGYLVFVPSYRLMKQADALGELEDVRAGMEFIGKQLAACRGDRDRVYLVGESAGAFLALFTAAMNRSEVLRQVFCCAPTGLSIRAVGCFSGMFYTTAKDLIGLVYPRLIYGDRMWDRSFMAYVNPENKEVMDHLPPMYLTSSHADFLKAHTLRYWNALRRNGNTVQLEFFADREQKHLTHAFPAIKPELQESKEVVEHLTDWFERI